MTVTGRCMCGAVRFEVDGPLRDVSVCHCVECRRWHGHAAAFTSAPWDALRLSGEEKLRWVVSPDSDAGARRAFCGECGASLFWDPPGSDTVSIAAGSLDPPTGLRTVKDIYTDSKSDYYELGS